MVLLLRISLRSGLRLGAESIFGYNVGTIVCSCSDGTTLLRNRQKLIGILSISMLVSLHTMARWAHLLVGLSWQAQLIGRTKVMPAHLTPVVWSIPLGADCCVAHPRQCSMIKPE
jgi:hypothetical protein